MAAKTQMKYELFARNYVIDLNATRSAIAAGYSQATAEQAGSRLLSNVKVRKAIDRLMSARASKLELKAERVAEELQRLAFYNMMDYMEIDENGQPMGLDLRNLTRDQAAAIQEISEDATGGQNDGERRLVLRRRFKLADKRGSLELLGRHLGMFEDKVTVSGDEALIAALSAGRKRLHGDSDKSAT